MALNALQRNIAVEVEAFDIATSSGAARGANRKLLASAAARKKNMIIASLDIDDAFLKCLTYEELAAATGEKERLACFALPPGSAAVLGQLPGFANGDEAKRCLQRLKPGTGTGNAPRAFSLKLRAITRGFWLQGDKNDEEMKSSK